MPAGPRRFVDGEFLDARVIRSCQSQFDIALADGRHPMRALADQSRCRRKRHLLAEQQHQRLEQQRKSGQLAGPRRLDLAHRAVRQPHPRYPDLEEAIVLEEVQVPVTLGHRVVHRMLPGNAGSAKRLPLAKSTRMVSVRAAASKSAAATDHGASMPRAASNSFSLIATIPSGYASRLSLPTQISTEAK